MKVAELMQSDVRTIRADATMAEVVLSLADAHVSGLPVLDGAGRMIGVVSATDVLTAQAESDGGDTGRSLLEQTAASDIMTPRPLTAAPDDEVREAARQMLYAEVHRLFVADGERLVGVISTTDIVRAVANGRV